MLIKKRTTKFNKKYFFWFVYFAISVLLVRQWSENKAFLNPGKVGINRYTKNGTIYPHLGTGGYRDTFPLVAKPRRNLIVDTDFKILTNDFSLLIYSAYIDIKSNYVCVIGIIRKDIEHVNCVFYYTKTNQYKTVKAKIHLLPEDHKRSHTAVHILCLRASPMDEPDEITLSLPGVNRGDVINDVTKFIAVSKIRDRVQEHQFTTCVSPLHASYDNTHRLIEWIEMNILLGAEKIIFYIYDVADDVISVLRYYELIGYVTIYSWTLPEMFRTTESRDIHLHYFGQMAALNDCVYKMKGISQYVTSFDLDEYIIPQRNKDLTWSDMLADYPGKSGYLFRCNFFTQRRGCHLKSSCRNGLSIDTYVMKDNIVLPSHKRSKYIVRPDDVVVAGIHFVTNTTTGSEILDVDPSVGLLHHYREDTKKYTKERITQKENHVAFKYSSKIRQRLKQAQNSLEPYLGGAYFAIDLV